MVKVIPQSDDYRRGWDGVRWDRARAPIADPFIDGPLVPDEVVRVYGGGRPILGLVAYPVAFMEVRRDG